jgi:hypothetical protein
VQFVVATALYRRDKRFTATERRRYNCVLSAWIFAESRQYEPDDGDSGRPNDSTGNR